MKDFFAPHNCLYFDMMVTIFYTAFPPPPNRLIDGSDPMLKNIIFLSLHKNCYGCWSHHFNLLNSVFFTLQSSFLFCFIIPIARLPVFVVERAARGLNLLYLRINCYCSNTILLPIFIIVCSHLFLLQASCTLLFISVPFLKITRMKNTIKMFILRCLVSSDITRT
jgi:hypothetical protein